MTQEIDKAVEALVMGTALLSESYSETHPILKRMESAITALREMRESQWQDISTAPKDGTRILIRFEHEMYSYARPEEKKIWEEVCSAKWIDHNQGGWTWEGICGKPTHWMPLPKPPAAKEG